MSTPIPINRICIACDSTTTYIRSGKYSVWRKHEGYWYCHKCFAKYITHPVYAPGYNKKWGPINSIKRLVFEGKQFHLKENPRKGVCESCGAIKGIDCKNTNIHHIEYHEEDILKDTIELCNSCHRKEHWRLIKLGLVY
jgi:hypothetical protein